jgi:hypothetical protein
MNIRVLLLWGTVAILMLQFGCQNVTEPVQQQGNATLTTLSGSVLRNDLLTAVPNAIVYDLGGLARDTSKNDGSFALHFQLTAHLAGKVVASRVGFGNDTVDFAIDPGVDTTIVLRLKADSTSPSTSTISGKAASIFLVGASDNNIGIRGTGSNETAQLTFEVRDSVGVPVSGNNKVNVNFSILGGPEGGEYVFPVSQVSDALTGRVSTRVTSGTAAGVLQVFASTIVDGRVIKSSPVRITISGGLPIQERFSISRTKANIAGLLYDNLRDRIQVIVGDKDGNPVQPGTAVYFTTTGGVIQASSPTNSDGIAGVDLISANPRPTGGLAIVTAKTVGDSGTVVSRTIPVVFSGAPQIDAPSQPFVITDSGSYSFDYSVHDINGNPLTEGTSISVSVDGAGAGELIIEGDKSVTLPDTDDPRFTQFSVRLRDQRTGGPGGLVNVTIQVASGQNGNATYKFSGIQQTTATVIDVPPSARKPSQVAILGNPTASDIFVAGIGKLENSVVRFEVRDSLGTPIDTSNRVSATFSIDFFPNSSVSGGTPPTVIPPTTVTNERGQFTASIVSGTEAGVVKLVARVMLPDGRTIVSQPVEVTVHAGFPDRAHFTYSTNGYSFAIQPGGFNPNFYVQVGDTFSNPVAVGTAVYFHTQAGVIQTGGFAYTDGNGRAAVSYLGGNPTPTVSGSNLAGRLTYDGTEGYFWTYVQTQGRDNVDIIDSLLVLWCVPPISASGLPTTDVSVPQGGTSNAVTVTLTDGRGNPLPVGTQISTGIDFTSDLVGIRFGVSGDLSSTQPFNMANYASVIYPGPRVTDFTIFVSDLSSGGGAPSGQTMIINITVNAPNIPGTATFSFRARIQ